MFRWGIIFLVIALIAAALGFGGPGGYSGLGS
ncbi:Small integral membrane protein [Enterobacter cloacae]|uniref:Small integral membrane protein n=1 Tax=Enterobacter cloacae TaxID=550 RepID=A0A377M6U5_ENTCL|nr:Small integral membrane protein [Enterobacter cloacae]